MITVHTDTSNLESALEEFARVTRKDLAEVTKKQAGILVGHVIALTPPGGRLGQAMTDSGGIGLDAKKRGEARVAADISRLFVTTRLPEPAIDKLIHTRDHLWENPQKGGRKVDVFRRANSMADLAAVHKAARNPRNGRTRQNGGATMAIARASLVKAYIRETIKKVGLLSAGWIEAARELGTASRAVPAWIKRHGSQPGGSDVRDSGPGIRIRIFNLQAWFPGNMESRIEIAMRRREAGLKKATAAVLERRAKAAERRMGR